MKLARFCLATILLTTPPMPARANPPDSLGPADWSAVPKETRKRLYMNREEAPVYPKDAVSPMQARDWPATKVIDGVLYDLKFASGLHDVVDGLVCCLSSIRPGWNYSTHYSRARRERLSNGDHFGRTMLSMAR